MVIYCIYYRRQGDLSKGTLHTAWNTGDGRAVRDKNYF